jgi:hypothetical protein
VMMERCKKGQSDIWYLRANFSQEQQQQNADRDSGFEKYKQIHLL